GPDRRPARAGRRAECCEARGGRHADVRGEGGGRRRVDPDPVAELAGTGRGREVGRSRDRRRVPLPHPPVDVGEVMSTPHDPWKVTGYTLLRVGIGVSLVAHAVPALLHLPDFVDRVRGMFAPLRLPAWMGVPFAWPIPPVAAG